MTLEEYMEIRNGITRQGTVVAALTSAESRVICLNTKIKGWYKANKNNKITETQMESLKKLAVRENRIRVLDKCGNLLVKGKDKFVYLIKNSYSHYKIGISASPRKRLNGLSTACSDTLVLVDFWEHPLRYSDVIEKELHDKFKQYHLRGEWFHFKDMTEKEIIKEISSHFT